MYAKKKRARVRETGRDCIRRLLQIVQVFWLGIESNYQESNRLHRIAGRGRRRGIALGDRDALTTILPVSALHGDNTVIQLQFNFRSHHYGERDLIARL